MPSDDLFHLIHKNKSDFKKTYKLHASAVEDRTCCWCWCWLCNTKEEVLRVFYTGRGCEKSDEYNNKIEFSLVFKKIDAASMWNVTLTSFIVLVVPSLYEFIKSSLYLPKRKLLNVHDVWSGFTTFALICYQYIQIWLLIALFGQICCFISWVAFWKNDLKEHVADAMIFDEESRLLGEKFTHSSYDGNNKMKQQQHQRTGKRLIYVTFNPLVRVILIPSISEYDNLGLSEFLWYSENDYREMRYSALKDIREFMKDHGQESVKSVVTILYQPNSNIIQPDESDVSNSYRHMVEVNDDNTIEMACEDITSYNIALADKSTLLKYDRAKSPSTITAINAMSNDNLQGMIIETEQIN